MGLEIQTGKVPGNVARTTPAERPAFIGLMILGLLGVILLMTVLVFWGIASGGNNAAAHDPAISEAPLGSLFINEQVIISFWLSIIFFSLGTMIFLYQRYFKDHVTVYKKRFRKWEDEGVQLHD